MSAENSFAYCPICGSNRFELQEPSLFVCGACNYHHHVNPVAAVAAFLTDPQGRTLFIRRAKEPSKGKLGAPGGFVDIGETAEAAVRREVKEEVNLELISLEFLCTQPNEYPYRGRIVPVLDVYFVGQVRSWSDAAALSEVDSLVLVDVKMVNPAELAFPSLVEAVRQFVIRDA